MSSKNLTVSVELLTDKAEDNTEERPEVKNLLESVETGCQAFIDEINEGIVRTVEKFTEIAEMTIRFSES